MLILPKEYYTSFPQYPSYSVVVSLWDKVQNSQELLERVLSGDPQFEYALIDAGNIQSREQLLAAVYRAIHDTEGSLKRTRNINSEVVFCLSHRNNIIEELKRFGISASTTTLYAIKVIQKENETLIRDSFRHLEASIKGEQVQFIEPNIQKYTDLSRLEANYKTTNPRAILDGMILRGYN